MIYLPSTEACPICNRPVKFTNRPFCSARCKLIDLGRWIDGDYKVCSENASEESEITDITHQPRSES